MEEKETGKSETPGKYFYGTDEHFKTVCTQRCQVRFADRIRIGSITCGRCENNIKRNPLEGYLICSKIAEASKNYKKDSSNQNLENENNQ